MFVEFSVGNFRSFREPVTLSMLASKRKSKNRTLNEGAVFKVSDEISLLKCATIYGANASGKSNLINAISFFKNFVISSSKESQSGEKINVTSFRLSSEFSDKPSNFTISFIIEKNLYQYRAEVSSEAVESESLKSYSLKASKEITLFERSQNKIKVGSKFPEGIGLENKTRKNALFLSVCANFDGAISNKIISWFRKIQIVNGLDDKSFLGFSAKMLADNELKPIVMNILESFDLGIDDFIVQEYPTRYFMDKKIPTDAFPELKPIIAELKKFEESKKLTERILSSIHTIFDKNGTPVDKAVFNFSTEESEGTKKIVSMVGPIVDSLSNSYILFIDEFDARLHSHLSKNFIKIFNTNDINHRNAQLIAVTHDTNLLDNNLLRRDQIWFIGKNKLQASQLHSLVEFKVRSNAIFQKEYDAGKYGAIPVLGDNCKFFADDLKREQVNNSSIGTEA